ncbi:hypothetical protein ACQY0O_001465 [Thecaphora frezii]
MIGSCTKRMQSQGSSTRCSRRTSTCPFEFEQLLKTLDRLKQSLREESKDLILVYKDNFLFLGPALQTIRDAKAELATRSKLTTGLAQSTSTSFTDSNYGGEGLCDNQAAIAAAHDPCQQQTLKHIDM